MNPGFWHSNFYPTDFWHEGFWSDFGGLTSANIHIFSTGSVGPAFVSDSGNNVLMNGSLETNGDIYTNDIFLPDFNFIAFSDALTGAAIFFRSTDDTLWISSNGGVNIEGNNSVVIDAPDTEIGSSGNYINIDNDGIQTFVGAAAINGLFIQTTRITSSPYTALRTDDDIFVDTDGGAITINLPAGIDGKKYRIVNVGSASNDVTVAPNGAELLTGANASRTLSDSSVIILTYEPTEGWW